MKQTFILLALTSMLILGACSSDESALPPEATGKGSIRMINAIKASPEVALLIQESTIGAADYRSTTMLSIYDDLDYVFSFEVIYAGSAGRVRFASQPLKMVLGTEHTMLLSGTLDSPAVTIWEAPERDFGAAETIFEARFAHTAESRGNLDFYFAAPGVAPAIGQAVGTLAFGEILPSVDFEAGDYVLTLTEADLPGSVVFESDATPFLLGTQSTIASFDGGANTSAPMIVKTYTRSGSSVSEATILDINFPSMSEFVHASLAMNSVDIYNEEITATSLPWVSGHNFKDVTNEVVLPVGDNPFIYVPTGLIAPALINFVVNDSGGGRARTLAVGLDAAFLISTYLPDRRPVDTAAKLQIYNSNTNFGAVDIYIVNADTLIDEQFPKIYGVPTATPTGAALLPAGSYDIYLTEPSEKEVLAGPIRLNANLGDVFGGIIYDMVDPALLEFVLITESQNP